LRGGLGREAAEHFEDAAGDAGRHGRTAGGDFGEGGGEFGERGGFEQVAGGAGADRAVDLLVILEGGENHDLGGRRGGFHVRDAIEAAHAGQADIEENHGRAGIGGVAEAGECVFTTVIQAGATKTRDGIDDARDVAAERGVVFDEPDGAEGFRHGGERRRWARGDR
jgi:hypothetical protein